MQAVRRVFQVFLSAVLLSFVLGCAGTAQKESTGEYIDDSVITSKVKAAFVNDKTLKASEINVETVKGTVMLSGFVSDPGNVSRAAEVAGGIKGVKWVRNELQVR